MLVDLRSKGLTGKEMEEALDSAWITCNKNAIPNDPQSPNVTSGVRLGTAAVSARGMRPEDMDRVAECIARMAENPNAYRDGVKAAVKELTAKYPLYRHLT